MVLVLECLLFDELVHQKDPQLHYHGAYAVALHHVLPKRLLFRAQSLGMSMAVKPEKSEISKDSERNEEKSRRFQRDRSHISRFSAKIWYIIGRF
ncbi:hypothetical protein WI664_03635 [Vibrio cholerae]